MAGVDGRRRLARRAGESWLTREVVGLAGAVALFVGVGVYYALAMPLFYPVDEQAHLGYAHVVADGGLPTIETPDPVPAEAVAWQTRLDRSPDDRYRTVWVANHPPLAYLITAPAIRAADVLGREDGGLMIMRLANVAAGAAGVVVVYLLGTELAAGDRRVGLAAAAMVALLPQLPFFFAHGQNDGLGFATAGAVLLAGVCYLRRGHGERTLAGLGVAVALAASTRAAGLLLGVAVVGVLAGAALVRSGGGLGERARRGAVVAGAGLGPAAVVIGWFYARNIHLYGDVGASDYLLRRFRREPRGSMWEIATDYERWGKLLDEMTSRTFRGPMVEDPPSLVAALLLVVAAAAVGLALAARHRAPGGDVPTWQGVGLCLLAVGIGVAVLVQHVSGGGHPFARYLYPGLPGAAAVVALGLDRLAPRVGPAVVAAAQAVVLLPVVRGTGRELDVRALKMPEAWRVVPGSTADRAVMLVVAAGGAVVLAAVMARGVGLSSKSPAPVRWRRPQQEEGDRWTSASG